MLEAVDLSVTLGGRAVLSGLSVGVSPGEVLVIVGPNGAGKSTLLGTLSGAIGPECGHVVLNGADVSGLKPGELALRRAVLEQTPPRDMPFTIEALLSLAIVQQIDPATAREITGRALAAVGLSDLAAQPVSAVSGGEAHRAHIARALAQLWAGRQLGYGHYLLIDEPTASLDLRHQRAICEAVQDCVADGAGVLMILHDLTLAAAIADRVVLLHRGRILAQGSARTTLCSANLSAAYGLPVKQAFVDGQMVIMPQIHAAQPQSPKMAS